MEKANAQNWDDVYIYEIGVKTRLPLSLLKVYSLLALSMQSGCPLRVALVHVKETIELQRRRIWNC